MGLHCCVFTTRCRYPARCLDSRSKSERAAGAPLTSVDQIYTGRVAGGRVRMSAVSAALGLLQGSVLGAVLSPGGLGVPLVSFCIAVNLVSVSGG